jgi:ribosomal protein L18E
MIKAKRNHRGGIGYIDNAPITNAIDIPSLEGSNTSISSLKSPNQIQPSSIDAAVSQVTINISSDITAGHHSLVLHERHVITESSRILKDGRSPDITSPDANTKEDTSLITKEASSIQRSFLEDQPSDGAYDTDEDDFAHYTQRDNVNAKDTLQDSECDSKSECYIEDQLSDASEPLLLPSDKTLDEISDGHNEKNTEIQYDVMAADSISESVDKDIVDDEGEEDIEYDLDGSSDFEAEEPSIEIKMEYANAVITNALAKKLIKEEREAVYTGDKIKSIVNVDTLSRSFKADDRVDVNILKKKSLVPYDTNYIKVLARGAIDKPLHVFANEFSLAAVKMILLSGGEAIRIISEKEKSKTKK